jgi:site-specific recombinase XerD
MYFGLASQPIYLEAGYDIRTIQELLRHKGANMTMIYMHILQQSRISLDSPLDKHS